MVDELRNEVVEADGHGVVDLDAALEKDPLVDGE